MYVFFKQLWQSLRDFSRAAAQLRQVSSRLNALEIKLDNQNQLLMRISRQQIKTLDVVAPPVTRIGG